MALYPVQNKKRIAVGTNQKRAFILVYSILWKYMVLDKRDWQFKTLHSAKERNRLPINDMETLISALSVKKLVKSCARCCFMPEILCA